MVFRVIPMEIHAIQDLDLPKVVEELAMEPRGLILVTGTTGSGKSTTLAAMIDYINQKQDHPHHHHRGPHRVPAPGQEVGRSTSARWGSTP